jgi:hypothetical protein
MIGRSEVAHLALQPSHIWLASKAPLCLSSNRSTGSKRGKEKFPCLDGLATLTVGSVSPIPVASDALSYEGGLVTRKTYHRT